MQHTCQPSLVTLRRNAAREAPLLPDIPTRVLLPQPPQRRPGAQGWAVLPATAGPLVVDLTGQSMIATAMLLTDLRAWQRGQQHAPLLLVPDHAIAQQRLIAAANLPAIVIGGAQPELVSRWLQAPVQVGDAPIWVNLDPLTPPAGSSHFVALFAALSRAETVPQAATWCAMSGRRAYRVLADSAQRLPIPPVPWRLPTQWVRAIAGGLAQRELAPHPPYPTEVSMSFHGFDVIAATLCGCTIERLTISGAMITMALTEPRQGALTCTCEDATILDAPAAYVDMPNRPTHARTIDWVDVLPDQTLLICFPDQTSLRVRMRTAQFARVHAT